MKKNAFNKNILVFDLSAYAMMMVLICTFAVSSWTPCISWGPVTHMSITIESGEKYGYPVSKDLLGAYLAGSTEPDVGLADDKSEDYWVYHSEEYALAMEKVAAGKKSPHRELLMARALGIRSHLAGDSSAHGSNGYANAKVMYPDSSSEPLPRHTTNELCVDMLMYRQNKSAFKGQKLHFLDVDTMIEVRKEYSAITGKELENDREKLKKELLAHKATVLTELALADHMAKNSADKLDEMAEVYSDFRTGVKDNQGADQGAVNISERVKGSDELLEYKISDLKFKMSDAFTNAVPSKALQLIEKGGMKIMGSNLLRHKAVDVVDSKISNKRNRSFLNFISNLMDKKLGFEEAVFMAGTRILDPDKSSEEKMQSLEMELRVLKIQKEKALEAYNNRPFWKFWLYFTNSDKKKYEELEKKYSEKLDELNALKKAAALTDASEAAENKNVAAEEISNSSAVLSKLESQKNAAWSMHVSSLEKGSTELAEKYKTEFLRLKNRITEIKSRLSLSK